MRVLSLFDGMACGMLAFLRVGLSIDEYHAYEIDKYAIQTAKHNFPNIQEHGDVFSADFTQYKGFDFLIGGSPCTYWSIAQSPDKRETTASGIGWELFSQNVRALHEAQPKFFIYENNKSMAKAIRESITEAFGFEPICINSALVSAQNRQRLYWVGRRNEDGTYSKVDVQQPEDRGILLKDIIGQGITWQKKSHCIDANYYKGGNYSSPQKQIGTTTDGKAYAVTSYYSTGQNAPHTIQKHIGSMVAEPVEIRPETATDLTERQMDYMTRGYPERRWAFLQRPGQDEKSKCPVANLSKGIPYNVCAEPIRCFTLPREDGEQTQSKEYRVYDIDDKGTTLCAGQGGMGTQTGLHAIPIEPQKVGEVGKGGQGNRVYSVDGKAVTQQANSGGLGSNMGLYAIPIEFDEQGKPTKAISTTDGKEHTVYEVKDGKITIKGKTYPIKLIDGYYIIRKLTVRECMRLQTVPEWYEFPVSNSQAYKMLGNGWTVEVIAHLIRACLNDKATAGE